MSKLTPREQMQEKAEQLREEKAQIEIYDKKTKKVIDHAEASIDNAVSKAKSMISGKPGIGYRVIKPL